MPGELESLQEQVRDSLQKVHDLVANKIVEEGKSSLCVTFSTCFR
jgi:hypothetical protein